MGEQHLTHVQHRPGGEDPEELDPREEDREDLRRVDALLEVGAVELVEQLVELRLERALAAECLHDRHPGDRLRDLRGDGGDPVAGLDQRATLDTRWYQRDSTSAGGTIASTTRPSRQSAITSVIAATGSSMALDSSAGIPSESTSLTASTSLVRRAMIQPAFCAEK